MGLFLALAAAISALFQALIIATGHTGGGRGAYATGLMWSPGLAALAVCRLRGVPLTSLGWGWGAWRWHWLAYATPLVYAGVSYGIVWYAGLGAFPDPEFIAWARRTLGWLHAPDGLVVVGDFLLVATTGLPAALAHALGEEIGWRGFLAPRMNDEFGFTVGAFLTGIVWTAWHMPILLFADYNAGTPAWFGLPCFAALAISMSIVMAWLRLVSGSLWTATLFHASHNLFIQGFFTPSTATQGRFTLYAIDEFGFAVPATAMLLAMATLLLRRRPAFAGR
jgi:membrane protease YdiL (CAAX protease family)